MRRALTTAIAAALVALSLSACVPTHSVPTEIDPCAAVIERGGTQHCR